MLKSLLRSTAAGVCFALGVVGVMAFAGTPTGVPSLTNVSTSATQGPGSTIAGSFPADYADINTMMSLLNNTLANYLSFNQTGEVGAGYFSNPASWNSTNTNCGSAGSECLVLYDSSGYKVYISAYHP